MSIETDQPVDDSQPSLMDAPPVDDQQQQQQPAAKDDSAPPADETDEQKAERETEEARRAALTDDERTAEDATAEEARRAALTDDERKAEDEAKAKAAGAPETYEDFTAPEGVTLNADAVEALKTFGKEHNLPQAAAQAVVDMGTKLMSDWQDTAINAFKERADGWRTASQADPEFGGPKLGESMPIAVRAREQFGTPALKELLDEFRLGDHPEVIRFFYKVGKATSEDVFVLPGSTPAASSVADRIYDHPDNKKK